jgi:ferredoxin
MALVSANDRDKRRRKLARVEEDLCLGCGVCIRKCEKGSLTLAPRAARVITPLDSTHRVVLMAIERGTLQDLIFDNRTLASHRALAAIFGVILRLSPVKRALASRQLQSRFLERAMRRHA